MKLNKMIKGIITGALLITSLLNVGCGKVNELDKDINKDMTDKEIMNTIKYNINREIKDNNQFDKYECVLIDEEDKYTFCIELKDNQNSHYLDEEEANNMIDICKDLNNKINDILIKYDREEALKREYIKVYTFVNTETSNGNAHCLLQRVYIDNEKITSNIYVQNKKGDIIMRYGGYNEESLEFLALLD